ncbi:DUF72 domain-containing protein [Vibrio brasiliensis]|uniref:DUF72 domain-containing protein n=1 Tax=Vibrio brasiliensis TaxID=170652 RepID=UPI001EFD5D92|nr:DUF72 domain-containing protein [Vibrio brasiliensis]MCG9752433.1 DUF72 domain-containing protein [Vibrio brasiliensis]MCG9781412.1 DUF72 domain-containing protein [Vibrio brasiliensis]
MDGLPIRLGLTMWSHNNWQQSFYGKGTKPAERLEKYASVFHTVEGNTTFYATPTPSTVNNWKSATDDQFRFTFKLPQEITHRQMLRGSQSQLKEFMQIMQPLHERIGQWTIQLPAAFGPENLETLKKFCALFPPDFPIGVEVRHADFFAKGEAEIALNQWLIEQGHDRIIMDSRPVFSEQLQADHPHYDSLLDAQQKKPKVPVHAIATANHPMVRFIGHPQEEKNMAFFKPWVSKLPQWIEQGKQPYLFIHTSDNLIAPELAANLYKCLQKQASLPDLSPFPADDGVSQLQMF